MLKRYFFMLLFALCALNAHEAQHYMIPEQTIGLAVTVPDDLVKLYEKNGQHAFANFEKGRFLMIHCSSTVSSLDEYLNHPSIEIWEHQTDVRGGVKREDVMGVSDVHQARSIAFCRILSTDKGMVSVKFICQLHHELGSEADLAEIALFKKEAAAILIIN